MTKLPKRKATVPHVSKSRHPLALKKHKGKKESRKPVHAAVGTSSEDEQSDEGEVQEDEWSDDNDGGDDDEEGSDNDEAEDNEDEDVDQEGMERLMKLLGEDGIDDFDRAQLQSLVGDDGDEESEEEEGEETGELSGEEDEESENDGENGNDADGAAADQTDKPIPLDEVDSIDEDVVPQQKLEIDNEVALGRIRATIQLDPALPWTETLTVTYPEKIEVDVDDDLNRELAFYKQALHSAQTARALASKHNFPFTRPSDYFAEMVKSDAHMERIRQRLLDESATIKKSEERRKEREGKKFGKRVQIEKLKEREKSKKEMGERLKNLKRKRKDVLDGAQDNGGDDFDVAVEDAISDRPSKRSKPSEGHGNNKKGRVPRNIRDQKFGFGGAGRRSKQNTRDSTDNFGPSRGRGKKGKVGAGSKGGKRQQRPGKSKRVAARSKR